MQQQSSVFGRLFAWAFFGALVYFGWTVGWPMLRERIEGATGPGGQCFRAADRAYRDFMTDHHPFVEHGQDAAAWDALKKRTEGQLLKARSLCACDLPSCAKARRSLEQTSQLLHVYDDSVAARGTVRNTSDLEGAIEGFLADAKRLARDGQ